jgi:membrane-associated phospholipid phosphatase
MELPLSRRVVEALPVSTAAAGLYFATGHRLAPAHAPWAHALDDRIPYLPASIWVYMPAYVGSFLLAIWVLRDARQLRAAFFAVLMLAVLVLPFHVLTPIACPRPDLPGGTGLTALAVRWLYAADPRINTFPSMHVANATLCAAMVTHANRRWGLLAWALAIGVWISVLTLKQHWFVDVPGGLGFAAIGYLAWRARVAGVPAVLPAALRVAPHRLRRH